MKEVTGRPIKLKTTGPNGIETMEEYILDESSQTLYQRSVTNVIRVGKLVQDETGARIDKS
jgi:hypothetical protein